eukprot:TRINITY_DN14296_c1_g1_i4.p1 TRINITY_DN14296_c1_g1~~TRINITY_DN14296_c1_g1_i4.p1  ORF type:complete len:1200 (+),score=215.71 TRINITY_DN14296_c1_g1_i4:82-3681(+)
MPVPPPLTVRIRAQWPGWGDEARGAPAAGGRPQHPPPPYSPHRTLCPSPGTQGSSRRTARSKATAGAVGMATPPPPPSPEARAATPPARHSVSRAASGWGGPRLSPTRPPRAGWVARRAEAAAGAGPDVGVLAARVAELRLENAAALEELEGLRRERLGRTPPPSAQQQRSRGTPPSQSDAPSPRHSAPPAPAAMGNGRWRRPSSSPESPRFPHVPGSVSAGSPGGSPLLRGRGEAPDGGPVGPWRPAAPSRPIPAPAVAPWQPGPESPPQPPAGGGALPLAPPPPLRPLAAPESEWSGSASECEAADSALLPLPAGRSRQPHPGRHTAARGEVRQLRGRVVELQRIAEELAAERDGALHRLKARARRGASSPLKGAQRGSPWRQRTPRLCEGHPARPPADSVGAFDGGSPESALQADILPPPPPDAGAAAPAACRRQPSPGAKRRRPPQKRQLQQQQRSAPTEPPPSPPPQPPAEEPPPGRHPLPAEEATRRQAAADPTPPADSPSAEWRSAGELGLSAASPGLSSVLDTRPCPVAIAAGGPPACFRQGAAESVALCPHAEVRPADPASPLCVEQGGVITAKLAAGEPEEDSLAFVPVAGSALQLGADGTEWRSAPLLRGGTKVATLTRTIRPLKGCSALRFVVTAPDGLDAATCTEILRAVHYQNRKHPATVGSRVFVFAVIPGGRDDPPGCDAEAAVSVLPPALWTSVHPEEVLLRSGSQPKAIAPDLVTGLPKATTAAGAVLRVVPVAGHQPAYDRILIGGGGGSGVPLEPLDGPGVAVRVTDDSTATLQDVLRVARATTFATDAPSAGERVLRVSLQLGPGAGDYSGLAGEVTSTVSVLPPAPARCGSGSLPRRAPPSTPQRMLGSSSRRASVWSSPDAPPSPRPRPRPSARPRPEVASPPAGPRQPAAAGTRPDAPSPPVAPGTASAPAPAAEAEAPPHASAAEAPPHATEAGAPAVAEAPPQRSSPTAQDSAEEPPRDAPDDPGVPSAPSADAAGGEPRGEPHAEQSALEETTGSRGPALSEFTASTPARRGSVALSSLSGSRARASSDASLPEDRLAAAFPLGCTVEVGGLQHPKWAQLNGRQGKVLGFAALDKGPRVIVAIEGEAEPLPFRPENLRAPGSADVAPAVVAPPPSHGRPAPEDAAPPPPPPVAAGVKIPAAQGSAGQRSGAGRGRGRGRGGQPPQPTPLRGE